MNRALRRLRQRTRAKSLPFPDTKCDHCGKPFEARLVEEPDLKGGVVGRFTCPHCSTTYEAYRMDAAGLAARDELKTVDSGSERAHELHALVKAHTEKGRGMLG